MSSLTDENLNNDWCYKTLNDVGTIFSGNSINAKLKSEKYQGVEGIPYIGTKDISYKYKINYDNGVNIPSDDENKYRIAKANTILICAEGGSAGRKMALLNQNVYFVNKLYALETNSSVIPKFCFYWYQTKEFNRNFRDKIKGLIGGVSKTDFKQLPIPIFSIDKQKRIVAKIDSLFAKIDKAIALTEENLQQAENLLPAVLNQVFEELEKKYDNYSLKDLCDLITDGSHFSPRTIEKGHPYVTVRDVSWEGDIDLINCSFISTEDFLKLKKNNCSPIKDDILYSKDGTVGKLAIVKTNEEFVVLSSLAILRPSSKINSGFLLYSMKSPKFYDFAISKKTGAAIKRVVLRTIKEFNISVPPISYQKELVDFLNRYSKVSLKKQSKLSSKLKYLKNLKSSILSKAFSGEL